MILPKDTVLLLTQTKESTSKEAYDFTIECLNDYLKVPLDKLSLKQYICHFLAEEKDCTVIQTENFVNHYFELFDYNRVSKEDQEYGGLFGHAAKPLFNIARRDFVRKILEYIRINIDPTLLTNKTQNNESKT